MPSARVACRRLIGAAAIAATTFAALPAFGQSAMQLAAQWPDRPVRLLVPVGAGGAADTLSRNLSIGFPQFANGQPLIVENRPGAGGTLAAAAVVHEKPDGYTLFLAEVGPNAVSHTLTSKLPYDPATAFTPIIHLVNLPAVVLIHPTLPHKTLPQLPDTPPAGRTIAGFDVGVWHGIAAPAGKDPALAERINTVFNTILKVPEVRTAIVERQAADLVAGSPQQFDAFIKGELKRWPEVVKAAGIKPE